MSECCSVNAKQVAFKLPVAIIGGGPIGLAAAAHLVERGESFILFEAANHIAGNIEKWKHVRLFSPWQYNINKAAKKLLEDYGWVAPPDDELPTGGELVENYLKPLAQLPDIQPNIYVGTRVVAISRKGLSKIKTAGREKLPFVIHVERDGERQTFEANAVIDASGTWSNPNPANAEGVWTSDETSLGQHIVYGIPDVLGSHRDQYKGKKVLVVGSGHSAINALLDLEKLKAEEPTTEIVWVIRKSSLVDVYGGQENDSLQERGALGIRLQQLVENGHAEVHTSFNLVRFSQQQDAITVTGYQDGELVRITGINEVISNTGSRPDMAFLREVRTLMDPSIESVDALAPLIDPNIHSCGTVRPHGERELRQPENNLYIVGAKSYGRAPTFLMATGYEQVRSVVAALTGDWESAAKVELDLPETGVCSIAGQKIETTSNKDCCSNDLTRAAIDSNSNSTCCS
nr:NAD(P)-binding domain-containing protein [Cohnella mopanensis]